MVISSCCSSYQLLQLFIPRAMVFGEVTQLISLR